jgi:hypothetical protein
MNDRTVDVCAQCGACRCDQCKTSNVVCRVCECAEIVVHTRGGTETLAELRERQGKQ